MKPAVDIIGVNATNDLDITDYLVEVELVGHVDDAFLKVKETLTRIGIASKKDAQTLYQTCHILFKRGRYYIVHFKSLFILDGRENNLTEQDIARQNTIIQLLEDWNLIKVVRPSQIREPKATMNGIKVVKYSEKDSWQLCMKYRLGRS